MIRRTVPGFSFCWVTDGSCRKDLIMLIFGRPYMTRGTFRCGDSFPDRRECCQPAANSQEAVRAGSRRRAPGRRHLGVVLAVHLGLATSGGATTSAQRHSGLGQDPMDEAVGPSRQGVQRANAFARVVSPA